MKKYVLKTKIHVVSLLSIIFNVSLFLLLQRIDKSVFDYVLLVFAGASIFTFIDNIANFYVFDGERLILKSMTKKIVINLSEVEYVVFQPAGKIISVSVGIIAGDKKISITSWTKDYKEILCLVFNKCKEREGISIDKRVSDIIKNSKQNERSVMAEDAPIKKPMDG